MSNRNQSDSSDSISLFPFLAVLLCTMGALLVLLVVLVDRAAQKAVLASREPVEQALAEVPIDDGEAEALEQELAQLASYQGKLDKLRSEGQERLKKQRERLVQVEASARALEQELAKLAIASMQLDQASQERQVDQHQAEAEAQRLEKLVAETEDQVEEMRETGEGTKSYAIVPYKGTNGTFRKPVYIECDKDGVTIQPEGLRLTYNDFVATEWPGNPLASILRATREYHNTRALEAGETQPPDPYPLLIVRPSGVEPFRDAQDAIRSWDADYGYEFIDEGTRITYRDMPDPLLAQTQEHALMVSRDRLSQMVLAAPRRFRGVVIDTQSPGSADGQSSSSRSWNTSSTGQGGALFGDGKKSTNKLSGHAGQWSHDGRATSEGFINPEGDSTSLGNVARGDETAQGELVAGDGGPTGEFTGEGDGQASGQEPNRTASNGQNQIGAGNGADQAGDSSAQVAGISAPLGKTENNINPSSDAMQPTPERARGALSAGTPTSTPQSRKGPRDSIAQQQGRNWAVTANGRHAIPIQRKISAMIWPGQVALLPEEHNLSRAAEKGATISLEQSADRIADDFTEALRDRVEQWGIAGSGMYWKPVLEVTVRPEAIEAAQEFKKLMEDSGVEVLLQESPLRSAAAPVQEGILR